MTARTFRCRDCGEERVASTSTGPLPTVCDVCDPEGAAERQRTRELARAGAARRAGELVTLRDRVAELEAALAFDAQADRASYLIREPGRLAVAQAVRRLAAAEGRQQTAERLLELAAAARGWARVLAANDVERALQTAAEEAAA